MTDDGDTTIVQRIINELKHDDIQVRCAAMGKLTVVSAALGPERTRNELLPFLQSCEDDEDEVLEILATQIGSLMEFIGGNEHLSCLVQATEPLLGAEQSKVREKAVDTCKRIAAAMSPEQVQEQFYLLLVRLHSAEWYSPQISLSALICTVYPHMPSDKKEELRKFYHELSTSSISLVRRGASANLGAFTKELEDEYVRPYVLPLLNAHVQDDQDHVRFMSVLTCVDLCSKLSDNESIEHVLPHAKKLATDNAWRVRYMAANHFCDLSKGFGETLVRSEMVDIFVELLQDREGEVRSAAASQITDFCQLLTEDIIISKILKPVSALANDTDEHVRASLAGHVMGLAPLLGKTKTLEHLLNLFLKLLRDEFYEVRLSVISKLNGVNQVIGIELLSDSLLPAITQLAEEKQWRVRLAIINFIPLLAKQLGVEFFDDKLAPLCLNWLVDPVFSIREAACKNIKDLIDVFGVEWGKESIIPKVFAFCDNSNYLYRSTNLLCVNTLTPVVGSDFIDSTLLPQVLRMVSDNVPNIRLKVAKTLKLFVKHTDATVVQERIRPVLDTLLNDNDKDVRFYAQEAVNAISCSA